MADLVLSTISGIESACKNWFDKKQQRKNESGPHVPSYTASEISLV